MADNITIEKSIGNWVIRADGAVLGETSNALVLKEGPTPPVVYLPRDDIAMAFFEKTDNASHCPYKGDATYYSIHANATVIKDAAWSYEDPKPELAAIKGHLAFYDSKVTVEQL